MTSGFLGLGDFSESFSELKRLTSVSDPALAKALKNLIKLRVVERTPAGKYKLRSGQRERLLAHLRPFYSEYYAEKAGLVAEGLAKFEGVLAVVLFGSTAQGKAAHDSDIDLLVVLASRDRALEGRIDKFVSDVCSKFDLPFEHVFLSFEGLNVIAKQERLFLFGIMEGYRRLFDRGGVCGLLAAKEKEIKQKYEYDEEVHMWLPKK